MFQSILFCRPQNAPLCTVEPACFRDLGLDRLVDAVTRDEQDPSLSAFYYTPLQTPEEVRYRQQILQELLRDETRVLWDRFSREICSLSVRLSAALEDLHSGDPWRCSYLLYGHFLDYGEQYCRCLDALRRQTAGAEYRSEGLRMAVQSIETLCSCAFYTQLQQTLRTLREKFDHTQYCMLIRHGTIRVKKYEGEADLSEKITDVFRKFQTDSAPKTPQDLPEVPRADHVEAGVLQCLSRIYPELFRELTGYVQEFSEFLDGGLLQLCRELRFYFSWLDQIAQLRADGLPFCFPRFGSEQLAADDFFDLLLAQQIGPKTVKNSFSLQPPERILVVTGPNQGGKTTFARAIGQIHYLASLGLCVPGTSACLLLTDQVLTHFEREEQLTRRSGKLEDDLLRLHGLLQTATDRSLIILNEIFASTVLEDAVRLGRHTLQAVLKRGACCVVVTFLDALAQEGPETVSMVGTVDPDHPEIRTFRMVRRPPDGRSYAMTLAEKHELTCDQILRRIAP